MPGIWSDFTKWAIGPDLLEFRTPNLWSKYDHTSLGYFKCEFSLSEDENPFIGWTLISQNNCYTNNVTLQLKNMDFVDHHGTQVGTMWVTYLTGSCYECFKQHCELLVAVSYQEEINCGFIKCWSQFHPWFYWTDFNETMPRTHSLSHLLHLTYCTYITKAYKARGKNHLLDSCTLSYPQRRTQNPDSVWKIPKTSPVRLAVH